MNESMQRLPAQPSDSMPSLPTGLPDIATAKLPAVYESAVSALSECSRIDECQAWANKSEALASYAKQSKDDQLRKMADRIQARAIRRCGELLKQIEPDKGGRPSETRDGGVPSLTRTQAATDAGLSERQRKTALRVASVDEGEFNEAVESEQPATVTSLADRGTQRKPKPAPEPLVDLGGIAPNDYARATQLQGTLKRFSDYCQSNEPGRIAKAFKPHEIKQIRSDVSVVDNWLDVLIANLPEVYPCIRSMT